MTELVHCPWDSSKEVDSAESHLRVCMRRVLWQSAGKALLEVPMLVSDF